MADEIDLATEVSEKLLEQALRRQRDRARQQQSPEPVTECTECGEALPETRIQHRFQLCVGCAEERERRAAR